MALSPASFRRRVAYDVINDYILPAVNTDSSSLEERKARAMLLPAFVVAIVERMERRPRLRESVRKCIEAYRDIVPLPEIGENEDVLSWYKKCLVKREEDSLQDWINRVAIASHCIMAYACIEQAIMPEPLTPMI